MPAMSSSSEPIPEAFAPRLCHLVKWADFDGYGFNLHAEKSRSGQFIGKVDADSPASCAGLREGDRIVEVNGVNIANENHRQVVERIKSVPGETRLLVVDDEADRWYKEKKIVVKSTMPNVRTVKTPVPRPEPPCYENVAPNSTERNPVGNGVHEAPPGSRSPKQGEEKHRNGSANGTVPPEKLSAPPPEQGEREPPPPDSPPAAKPKEESHSRSSTPSAPDSPGSARSGPSPDEGTLNLNMSAHEMRAMLANRRKKDPKKEPMDIRQKYEIIQQM